MSHRVVSMRFCGGGYVAGCECGWASKPARKDEARGEFHEHLYPYVSLAQLANEQRKAVAEGPEAERDAYKHAIAEMIADGWIAHDSWRCYSDYYPNECHCGLDAYLSSFGSGYVGALTMNGEARGI